VARWPILLPDLWREPRGPDPDGVLVLLLVGTGILDELGWRAFKRPGGPDTEVFLELGRELLLVQLILLIKIRMPQIPI